MKQIWAPWRIEYIKGEKPGGCIFCDAPEKEAEESLLLFDGSLSMVLLNRYPYNNGHLMVAPKRHEADLEALTVEESIDVFRLLRHSVAVLRQIFNPDGFNIGLNIGQAAGAGIEDHLHWHIVPRWSGDTNFMPLLAEVRVIPEHLLETLSALRPHFERL